MNNTNQSQEALDQIKSVYEDNEAEINGRIYRLTKTKHKQRLKVFAYFTKIQNEISAGSFGFLDTPEFDKIYDVMANIITYDGSALSKLHDHWEEYEEDFIMLIISMMGAISYPFLKGSLTS